MDHQHTNNPVEATNKFIKQQFTKHVSLTVLNAVDMLAKKVLPYFNLTKTDYFSFRKPDKEVKARASKLDASKFQRSATNANIIWYYGFSQLITIRSDHRHCSCRWFNAYAVCHHLYRAMLIFDIQFDQARFVNRTRQKKVQESAQVDVNVQLALQCQFNMYRSFLGLPAVDVASCLSSTK